MAKRGPCGSSCHCACFFCATVKDAGTGAVLSGATVTVTKSGASIGTCTTDATGKCCLTVTSTGAGTYTYTAAKTGYTTSTAANVSVGCPGTTNVTVNLTASTGITFHINTSQVMGCTVFGGIGIPGAVVSFGSAAGLSNYGTLTANSTGNYSGNITIPAGGVTVHYSGAPGASDPAATRFAADSDRTFTASGSSATLPTITLSPATGYHCSGLVYYPLGASLTLTDTCIGTFTLAWDGVSKWVASFTKNFPGGGNGVCPASTGLNCSYSFSGTSANFTYPTDGTTHCPKSTGTFSNTLSFSLTTSGTAYPLNATASYTYNPFSSTPQNWYDDVQCSPTVTLTE